MGQKHTPGPWTTERELNAKGTADAAAGRCGVEIHRNGVHIGTWIDNEWDGMSPNARLVAAAPFLLAACKMALGAADQEYGENPPPCVDDLIPTLRAAIAKAEGA